MRATLGQHLVAGDHLHHTRRVAQVEEGHTAVIAAPGDPSREGDGLAGLVGAQRAGLVGAEHGGSFGGGWRTARSSYGGRRLPYESMATVPSHRTPTYVVAMRAGWRWAVCAVTVAVLVAVPFAVRYAPVSAPDAGPAALLARMQASWSNPYQGYAESTGALALPTTDQLNDLSTLLSGRTQMRVWWRSATDWRADTITPAGERSTRTTVAGSLVWDYEDNRVGVAAPDADNPVRLPRETDTLPPQLAARMLSEATADELSALPARRVAGRPAEGLRLRPSDSLSSVGRVDVWADAASGIPVLVEVFGRAGDVAGHVEHLPRLLRRRPRDGGPGVRRAARCPHAVGGRAPTSSGTSPGSVDRGRRTPCSASPGPGPARRVQTIGEYGRGRHPARGRVRSRPGWPARCATRCDSRPAPASCRRASSSSVGPLGLLLTTSRGGTTWLVAGTVTAEGLARAATELGAVAA